jgi:hypothetical protein
MTKVPALAVHKTSSVPVGFAVKFSGVLAQSVPVMLLSRQQQHKHLKGVKKFFIFTLEEHSFAGKDKE